MLTPEQLASLPDEIVRQLVQLEDFILDDISRRLAKNMRLTDTALQQMKVLANAGMEMQDLKKEIQKRLDVSAEELKKILNDASGLSYEQDIVAYLKGGKELPALAANAAMQNLIQSAVNNAWDDMRNMTNTIGFVQNGRFTLLDDYYQQTLGQGVLQVASGVIDYQTALKMAVKTLADSGIRMIDYDNTVPYHVDVAARRAVLTTINQITGQMSEANADLMDQDIMEITAHSGARPTHAVWQGELVSRSGRSGYLSLSDIGHGDVQGFMGANCRHNWYPFFEGISERMWNKKSLSRLDNPPFEYEGREYTHYEATQRMRQLERGMRKTKRQLIGYDAAELKDDFTAKSIYLRRQREQYQDFANSARLKPQLDRIGVQGYNRSISSKSTWAINKATYDKYKDFLEPLGYKQTMDKIRAIEFAGDKWLLDGFVKAVRSNQVHVLVGIDRYIRTAREIESKLVGKTVPTGDRIDGYVTHFVDRVIGQVAEKHPGKRTGVSVDNILEILRDEKVQVLPGTTSKGSARLRFHSQKGIVTLEKDTNLLIQVNP